MDQRSPMELASSFLADQNCEKLYQTSSALDQQSFAHVDYTSHPLISERRSRSVMDQFNWSISWPFNRNECEIKHQFALETLTRALAEELLPFATTMRIEECVRNATDVLQFCGNAELSLLLAFEYAHKYNKRCNSMKISPEMIFAVAIVIAMKFLDDNVYSNRRIAWELKIPLKRLNCMELYFLETVEYKLYESLSAKNIKNLETRSMFDEILQGAQF